MAGICLRGKPGWGEVLAPLDTVINTFGGRWFDENWNAQLTSPEVEKAVQFYVDLVRAHGEPGAGDKRIQRVRRPIRAGQGRDVVRRHLGGIGARGSGVVQRRRQDRLCACADRRRSPTPAGCTRWSLGIPKSSKNQEAAWKFISWMTSKDYLQTGRSRNWAGRGFLRAAGCRPTRSRSTSRCRRAYGPLTLESIENADPKKPTVQPVPYTGIQFLAIPEFQDLGTRVSQQISAAIAGQKSVNDALAQSQKYAEVVGKTYQEKS